MSREGGSARRAGGRKSAGVVALGRKYWRRRGRGKVLVEKGEGESPG